MVGGGGGLPVNLHCLVMLCDDGRLGVGGRSR